MSFRVNLNMHGLCFYVPDEYGKAMHVLLVDPPQPAPSAPTNGHDHAASSSVPAPHVHEVHEPLLVVNELDLHPRSQRVPDFQYSDGNRLAAFRLRDLEFNLGDPKVPALTIINNEQAETCPKAEDFRSFSWVVPLSRINGALGPLDPRCLASRNIHPTVAGRIHLYGGELGTFSFSSPASRPTAVWEFVSSDGVKADHRQAIADVVQLQFDVATPSLQLTFNSLRGVFAAPNLELRPRPGEDELTVFVKCMPIEDVLGFRAPQELVPGESRSRDAHFSHFFDLFVSQGDRQLTYAPQLAMQSCSPGVIPPTIGQVHCPGGTS